MRALVSAIIVGLWTVCAPAFAAAPRVVTSVKPVHALVAGVMEGVGTPDLLMKGGGSPHTYSLRPSEAEALARADVVFWIGPAFEIFLAKPLASLAAQAHTVALMDAPDVQVFPARAGGVWNIEAEGEHAHSRHDGHIWLNPDNDVAMIGAIARTLSARDPTNAARYGANAAALIAKMKDLDNELRRKLAPIKDKPFVVFHDAYQYFEARYGLHAVGAITVTPDRAPGARRVAEIRREIEHLGPACVFAEPQFEPKLVQTLVAGTRARTGVLDPEGSTLAPGPNLQFNLLRNLADGLIACLGAP